MDKKIWATIGGVALIAATALPALAADTGIVSATVTPQLISISITTDGEVAYGTLPSNASKDTIALTDTQSANNNGNVAENFNIKSSDATSSGTTWELAVSAGSDAFTHEFSTNSGTDWAAFNVDNTTYSTLATNVAVSGNQSFDLRIGTPTSSTDLLEHTINVTVQATAI